jgi:gamma-glutamyltranspeptidase/glutathione hydrolase
MVWDPEGERLYGLNASGRSPAELTIDKVPADEEGRIPLYSPYAWSVPGCVDGWFELHGKFGRVPMAELLAPTVNYALDGFPVPQIIAGGWELNARRFKDKPGFAEVFMPNGETVREGQIFTNRAFARTLKLIAMGGRDAYYKGPIAEKIVEFSNELGGFFTLEDFAAHRSEWVEPISTTYHGTTVWELPPNGQGLAALQILNILEELDAASFGRSSAEFWHLFIEAKKLAFEDRARFYADPAFTTAPIETLASKEYAAKKAALVDRKKAGSSYPAGHEGLEHGDTTFLVTADSDGMMVALIQSNYTGFGSGYVIAELGFGLQNRGGLFTLEEGHPNSLQPGKRPFHTIIPAFMGADGTPDTAFGVMGGSMQPQGHAQIVVNVVDFGMNLQEAGDAARFFHGGSSEPTGEQMSDGGYVCLESGVPVDVRRELMRRGHRLVENDGGVFGGYQAIYRDPETGVYYGATESRKDGVALGY